MTSYRSVNAAALSAAPAVNTDPSVPCHIYNTITGEDILAPTACPNDGHCGAVNVTISDATHPTPVPVIVMSYCPSVPGAADYSQCHEDLQVSTS